MLPPSTWVWLWPRIHVDAGCLLGWIHGMQDLSICTLLTSTCWAWLAESQDHWHWKSPPRSWSPTFDQHLVTSPGPECHVQPFLGHCWCETKRHLFICCGAVEFDPHFISHPHCQVEKASRWDGFVSKPARKAPCSGNVCWWVNVHWALCRG